MDHIEHIWTMIVLKICKHTFYVYLKIYAIYAFYMESFCDKFFLLCLAHDMNILNNKFKSSDTDQTTFGNETQERKSSWSFG